MSEKSSSLYQTEVSLVLMRFRIEAGCGVVGPPTALFKLSLHRNRVPDEWKEAIVCPIFKGGRKARQDSTNYRAIIVNLLCGSNNGLRNL